MSLDSLLLVVTPALKPPWEEKCCRFPVIFHSIINSIYKFLTLIIGIGKILLNSQLKQNYTLVYRHKISVNYKSTMLL